MQLRIRCRREKEFGPYGNFVEGTHAHSRYLKIYTMFFFSPVNLGELGTTPLKVYA